MGHEQAGAREAGSKILARGESGGLARAAFANKLFEGAAKDADELDALIVQHAQNWRLERMAIIDRAVLRLAIYELRNGETPPRVVLNEAVELAKKFSSEEAGLVCERHPRCHP